MTINTRSSKKTDADHPGTLPAKGVDQSPNSPDSIPDILPGVDPQQTPGIDHLPAESNPHDRADKRHP